MGLCFLTMVTKNVLKTCPWCGAPDTYGLVERDIGRSKGLFCSKCKYFNEVK